MINILADSSRLHAMVYRDTNGKGGFLLIPHCVFCIRAAGKPIPFSGVLHVSAAYVCDDCIEKRKDKPEDNLSLASPGGEFHVPEPGPSYTVKVSDLSKMIANGQPVTVTPTTKKKRARP